MNNKIEEIIDFVSDYIDSENHIIQTDNFEDICDLIEFVNNKFNCDIKIRYVGGFKNQDCEVDCYAWAGIIDGELYFDYLEEEWYQ